nr:hypothetical protein [Acidobacteriota bacterium]
MQRPFAIAACILFVAGLTVWPAAQGLEKIPTPIDVYAAAPSAPATPGGSGAKAVVPPGSPVRLYGTTVPNGKTPALMQVKIAVKPPSGATTNLVAAMKPDGAFETTFTGSSVSGEFTVTALAPDGKATATTTFVVATPSAIGSVVDALFTELEKGTPDMNAGVSAASTSLANKGPYPEQDKVAQNLAQITAATNELTAKLKVARQGLAKLGDIAKTYPGGAGELEPITTAIATGTAEAEAARQKVVAATASVGKSSGICDRIDAVLEALSAVSLWYDVQGKLFAKVVQLATDKYLPDRIYNAAVPPAKRDNTEKFGLA